MNRRRFLQRASLAVAGMAIDPEVLVWTPGKRTYFEIHQPVPDMGWLNEMIATAVKQHDIIFERTFLGPQRSVRYEFEVR